MASGPITSWQIDGETVTHLLLGGSKITEDGECSHEINWRFLLGRSYDQSRQPIKKQSHYFANKGLSSQVKSLSRVQLFATPLTVAYKDRPSMGFSRQEYWSGLPFPSPVKAMVFPVVMYWYESWTIKKAEHWRFDAFELWCWRRLGLQGDPTSPS